MKQQNKFLIGALALQLSISSAAFATTGKVVKARGKKVLIEMPIDPRLQPGDTVEVDTVELRSPSSMRPSIGGRQLTLSGSTNGGDLHFYSRNNGYNGDTTFNVIGRGGWNFTKYEYGPIAQILYQSADSNNSITNFGAGGYFDYNFVPNAPGATDVYGIGGDAELSSLNIKVAGTSTSTAGLAVNGGGFYKYFLFKSDTCLRLDGQIHLAAYDKFTESGLRFLAGLQIYF